MEHIVNIDRILVSQTPPESTNLAWYNPARHELRVFVNGEWAIAAGDAVTREEFYQLEGIVTEQGTILEGKITGTLVQTTGQGTDNVMSQKATTDALGGKADRVSGAASGDVAALDANGNLIDGGVPANNVAQKNGNYPNMTVGLSENLESWQGSALRVADTQKAIIFTTGGDESIDSSVAAQLQSIKALSGSFAASSLNTSGFNLLRLVSNGGLATAVGTGWYIPVPALVYTAAGTATTPNGLLLTDNNHNNISNATVRFKSLASGVPTSTADGDPCAYTDVSYGGKSYRFYTCSGPGYMIISGITYDNTCAHLGWSSRYDDFVSPTATGDAGSSIALTSILGTIHSGYSKLITVGGLSDEIAAVSASQLKWFRRCDRVAASSLSWTHVQGDNDNYTHTATIASMKDNGVAEFESDSIALTVNGQTVSFTDSNATVTSTDYIRFQLAVEASGTVSTASTLNVEDWGIIAFFGADGYPIVAISYAQGMPDSLRTIAVTRMKNVEDSINAINEYLDTGEIEDNSEFDLMPSLGGQPAILFCAGAPAANNKPTNWIDCVDGGYEWTGLPAVIGQHVRDITNSADYYGWLNPSTSLLEWK